MGKIVLSVIMPTYNSSTYIDTTIQSLMESLGRFKEQCEIICVDDGSSDDTLERLKEYAKTNLVINVVALQHNGVSNARNVGLKKASGRYVTFVDSDDLFVKDFYPTFQQQIKEDPDIILEDVHGIKEDKFFNNLIDEEKLSVMKINLRFGDITLPWGIGSRIYKRPFLMGNHLLFDTELVVSEDMLFILEAVSYAQSLILSPKRFYFLQASHTLFHYNPKNLHSELHFRKEMEQLMQKYHHLLAEDINNRTKLTGFIFLIDSYFGPLCQNKGISYSEASRELSQIASDYHYDDAFSEKKFDEFLSRKAPIFRRLLHHKQFKLVLILNVFIDRLLLIRR